MDGSLSWLATAAICPARKLHTLERTYTRVTELFKSRLLALLPVDYFFVFSKEKVTGFLTAHLRTKLSLHGLHLFPIRLCLFIFASARICLVSDT